MKLKKSLAAPVIFILGLGLHAAMLMNLTLHFEWKSLLPPRWTPVVTESKEPLHWDRDANPIGPFSSTQHSYFDRRLQEEKRKMIQSKTLIEIPTRHTGNFGLDFLVRDATRTDPGGDFFQLYQSGWDARFGTSIYENYPREMPPALRQKLKSAAPFHPPNRYPPAFAYSVGLSLSLFSPWNAYLYWTMLHEAAIALCLVLTWKIARSRYDFLLAAGMWLGFLPWYLELYMGQTTFLIMTATMVFMAGSLNKTSRLSVGAWWFLSLITKPLTLLFVPVFLRLRWFGVLALGLATATAGSGVYFIFHHEDAKMFAEWAFGQSMVFSLGNFCFQNLIYHFLFSDRAVKIITIGACFSGLLFTFFKRPFVPVRDYAMWICVYFLAYAHVWQHHLVLILPAAITPFLLTGRLRFALPWLLAALPSPFYLFEGHWNWTREVIYLLWGASPSVSLLIMLMFTSFQKSDNGMTNDDA